jgi:hypothetical protein
MEITWTDHMKNEVLHIVNEKRDVPHIIKRRKANWIAHILLKNCF